MKYYLLTLGCPKNTVDSEGIAMMLSDAGYGGTAVPDDADVLIVNTCGFLQAAEDESLANLRDLAGSKRRGQVLIAAGCMAQRNGSRIIQEVPGVDGLLGTRRWMEVVPFIKGLRDAKLSVPDARGVNARTSGATPVVAFGRYALLGDPEHPLSTAMPRPRVQNGSART